MPSARVLFEWKSLDHVADRRDARTGRQDPSTTSTSTRSTSTATATCSSRPATRGPSTRSAARRARCSGGSAARRATSQWGRAPSSPGSTTRAHQDGGRRIRIFDDGARAGGRAAVACARDRARPQEPPCDARRQVHAQAGRHPRAVHGERAAARQRERARRLGQRAVHHRVRPERRRSASTPSCRTAARTTERSASRGSDGRPTSPSWSARRAARASST